MLTIERLVDQSFYLFTSDGPVEIVLGRLVIEHKKRGVKVCINAPRQIKILCDRHLSDAEIDQIRQEIRERNAQTTEGTCPASQP